ncbi:MAG: STAS domain-containing protein [Spirochaetaceae bacterium]|nr:STAS domain-containing protein [Spirochaetaceae bacterium]
MEINYVENSANASLLVKVAGDCDMYSVREFFTEVTGKMVRGFMSVSVDFSKVIYLDSSGVGAIIRIIRLSKEKNIDLKFRGITGTPRKVLQMSNILTLIKEET